MLRLAPVTRVAFASGMVFLGMIGLAFRDFGLVWGSLPGWVPWQPAIACICAALAMAAGIALLFERTAARASLVAFLYVGIWWCLFRVPEVVEAPLTEVSWLTCGMLGILLAGAWTLFADLGWWPFLADERGMTLARRLFGLALIPIGLSHFVYTAAAVGLVPSWLPYQVGWAYFTGACHLAAALAVLFGVLPRLAAQLEAIMIGIVTLLVWIPMVVSAPTVHGNWVELWISWALTGAAAVVAVHVPRRELQPAA